MATFTDPWTGERRTITRHQRPAPAVKPMPKGISINEKGQWGFSPPFGERNAADWQQHVKDASKRIRGW